MVVSEPKISFELKGFELLILSLVFSNRFQNPKHLQLMMFEKSCRLSYDLLSDIRVMSL